MRFLSLLLFLITFTFSSVAFAQDGDPDEVLLFYWHFNDHTVDEEIPTPIASDFAASGLDDASTDHNFSDPHLNFIAHSTSTDVNLQPGYGEGNSLRLREGASPGNNGKYLQIDFSAEGYINAFLRYAVRATGSGFDTHEVMVWSEGDDDFVTVETIDLEEAGAIDAFGLIEVDLSDIEDLNDVQLRIVVEGATFHSGLNYIDNLTIHGIEIPECSLPEITHVVDEEDRTIEVDIVDGNGIELVHFLNQDNDESGLENLFVAEYPDAFTPDDDVLTFELEDGEEPPTTATFVLQATEMEDPVHVSFYVTANNTCGGQTYLDPPYAFAASEGSSTALDVYPNPFTGTATISVTLEEAGHVTLRVFDMLGRSVATLLDDFHPEGTHTVEWVGESNAGGQLASGTYLLRLETETATSTRPIVRVR